MSGSDREVITSTTPLKKYEVTIEETALTTLAVKAFSVEDAEKRALSMDYELNIFQRHVVVCRKK